MDVNPIDVRIGAVASDGCHVTLSFLGKGENHSDHDDDCDRSEPSGTSTYHAAWLWSNDPRRVLPSGQRASTPGHWVASGRPRIREAEVVYCRIAPRGGTKDGTRAGDAAAPGAEADVPTAEDTLRVPGPTAEDSSHPLPIYGPYPAWVSATPETADAPPTRDRRPYLKIVWSATPSASAGESQKPTGPGANQNSTSIYDVAWLQRCRYDSAATRRHRMRTEVRPIHAIRRDGPPLRYSAPEAGRKPLGADGALPHGSDGLTHVDYHEIIGPDGGVLPGGLFRLHDAVFRDGAALVAGAPHDPAAGEDDLAVVRVARALGGGSLSHGSLYGSVFHVRVGERHASNAAYTAAALAPHQDLAYYDAPPGLQLLHCAGLGARVQGGESTLLDCLAAAHRLREARPESFATLVRCPATFVKQRDGAGMTYRRPHISLDLGGEITAVHWSPPFEGPACLPPDQMEGYYEAYADFERLVNPSGENDGALADDLSRYARDFTWERALRPGEILVFNNRRMLHGRRGFSSPPGASAEDSERHLIGCYTDIDDTLNSYRVLLRERGAAAAPILNVGNGTNIWP